MGFLESIEISSVETTFVNTEAYKIVAHWNIKGSYDKDYSVNVTDSDSVVIKTEAVNATKINMDLTAVDISKKYYIQVCVDTIKSAKIEILLQGIQKFSAIYRDDAILLNWEKINENIKKGLILIHAECPIVYDYKPFLKNYYLPLSNISCNNTDKITITMNVLGKDGISTGPSTKLSIYLDSPRIQSIVSVVEDTKDVTVKITYTHPYTDITDKRVYVYFINEQGIKYTTKSQPLVATGAESPFSLPKTSAFNINTIHQYKVLCLIATDSYKSQDYNWDNALPLGQVTITNCKTMGNKGELAWKYDGIGTPSHYNVTYKKITTTPSTANWKTEDYNVTNTDQTVTITPIFEDKIGRSMQTSLFEKSYLLKADEQKVNKLVLNMQLQEQTTLNLLYDNTLFLKAPEPWVDLIEAPFTLTKIGTNYLMTVADVNNVTVENLEKILLLLEQNNLTIESLLKIQYQLTRTLPFKPEDLLRYHYNLTVTDGTIDLKAGMTLSIESEAYKFKEVDAESNDYNSSGFILNQVTEYKIRSDGKSNDYKLKFDSFANAMSSYFKVEQSDSVSQEDQNYARYCASGLMDFYQNKFSNPYMKMVYPKSFTNSAINTNDFAGNHIMILSCDKMVNMNTAMKKLKTEVDLSKVPAVILFLRGRTTISVKIPIMWQGERRLVDVGTTLYQLMEEDNLSVSSLEKLVWKRSLQNVIVVPDPNKINEHIKMDFITIKPATDANSANLMKIPLLHGDVLNFETANLC